MITRLRPLDLKLDFEERQYKLGDAIDARVELHPNRDVEVREGRVDLVCEMRYSEVDTVKVPARSELLNISDAEPLFFHVTKRVLKEHRKTYVGSSAVFLTDARLESGTVRRYNARLEIEPQPPSHASEATIKWSLVAVVDVAHARDVKKRSTVRVALS